MIAKPIEVRALRKYSIFVGFSDGTQGAVDLEHLAHKGVFKAWDTCDLFNRVYIDECGAIAWNDELDICPDHVYLQLKGLTFEEWRQEQQRSYATD
ncbi:MAG: DUF2442 domain-containing protein [Tannerellaceae bacterium]|jgi:hypothetical protein|nr:DUF2442 domain-containing protein [Tannerellaceae bacterium]